MRDEERERDAGWWGVATRDPEGGGAHARAASVAMGAAV